MDAVEAHEFIKKYDFEEVIVRKLSTKTQQVKFSNNEIDITNNWDETGFDIYVTKGRKIYNFDVKNEKDLEKSVINAEKALRLLEDNPDYFKINSEKYQYRSRSNRIIKISNFDISQFTKDFLDDNIKFAKRIGGTIYKKSMELEVVTNYNNFKDLNKSIEFNVRAFNENDIPTQQSFATSHDDDLENIYKVGEELRDHLRMLGKTVQGSEGTYHAVLHPLFFASIVSYTLPMASAYQVDSGISFFAERLNQKIGSSLFTLYDDATDDSMFGSRIADDEGVPTKKTPVIEKGFVKNYLHNTSTAIKFNSESTGNAGIISPTPWQVSVEPGTEDPKEMIESIRDGLYIVNTWYTRFQDYREGIFSTIPRDGIYRIKNGEVIESWTGMRVSDSLINIFKGIEGVSRETKKVKWWDETMYSKVPYVYVSKLNITKSK